MQPNRFLFHHPPLQVNQIILILPVTKRVPQIPIIMKRLFDTQTIILFYVISQKHLYPRKDERFQYNSLTLIQTRLHKKLQLIIKKASKGIFWLVARVFCFHAPIAINAYAHYYRPVDLSPTYLKASREEG